jgi:aryl-alcohol dehydrogenase-like predicted oxidoreductase
MSYDIPGGLTAMPIQNRILGRTGVSVSPLCLGAMMFGPWGNKSERIVGKALAGRRDDVVLATKFFMPMGSDPNQRGGSRRWIIRAVEGSLRRLERSHRDPDHSLRP